MRSGFVQPPLWISTEEMAETIGIHPKTLLGLRRKNICPFIEGTHYRRKGATTRSPLQWQPEKTEQAFTSFKRADPEEIETYAERSGEINQ